MAIRDTISASVKPFLAPGEELQQVVPSQTASQYVAAFAGLLFFLPLNRYRVLAVTSHRILILDAGKFSWKKARAVVGELPRATRLGPGTGMWHVVPANGEKLRVHRRFFKDMAGADAVLNPSA
jgi:hypothetical protein